MLDPRIVANTVLSRANRSGIALTNLDIQKMLYLLHGEFLRQTRQPLVTGEFQAWEYGPVHRVLYDAFKSYKDGPIDGPARRLDPIRRRYVELPRLDDPMIEDFLDANLTRLLSIPTFKLVQITHAPGTPWSRTMEAGTKKTNLGMVISNEMIARHFEGAVVFGRAAKGMVAA
ncbi:Panacea domain-containing protein [Neoroseomonas soli]|uniref:DUF4065 domain-containing protein n=1 Tax=Neoroseomonas soli TaxID=1081025 RepID=A0A9X9X098_9PROT|nr:type II toxin-antitoxin system antitoxin SocA domain-containing protein [Neoroseomonas soli]MBR0672827.1 DUF4065 domain-containing protein [Neoroseomonas soli]